MSETDNTTEAVKETLRTMVKVIRELGPSMSPGALAACIERNLDDEAAKIVARCRP